MIPLRELPETYQPVGTLDLSKDRKALMLLNLLAFVVILAVWSFFMRLVEWMRPDAAAEGLTLAINGLGDLGKYVLLILVLTGVMLALHEGIHGLFFWLFTRSRPRFAVRLAYAYAAAPEWYLPRNQYLVTALSPLVGITLICVLLILVVPPAWFWAVGFVMIFNASGAVGDLWVAGWLLTMPSDCYACDCGDAVTLYRRGGAPRP